MNDTIADLRAEYAGLAELAGSLTVEQWQLPSKFYGWTPWDEIAHLLFFDETALKSATNPEEFARDTLALTVLLATGKEISAIARETYGHLDGAKLLATWEPIFSRLADSLSGLDPKARLAWYGPSMSARSFATARMMETWAHGQDVWDVVARQRPATRRLKHIAHLGVTTFAWTFLNRKLPVPKVAPYVELEAPEGGVWNWGDPASSEFVRGSAQDFCLLITQRRNLADTALRYSTGSALQWLSIAQCFAGPPSDPPVSGARQVSYGS